MSLYNGLMRGAGYFNQFMGIHNIVNFAETHDVKYILGAAALYISGKIMQGAADRNSLRSELGALEAKLKGNQK